MEALKSMMILALRDAVWLLRTLGEIEQAGACETAVTRMCAHVPVCGGSKQAAAMLSLSGLGNAEELNREIISPGGAHGYSTFMGYYLLAAKAKAGDMEGALRDMRSYWGGMLDMGATTFWEDFNLEWMRNAGRIDELLPEGKTDIHGDYGAYCYQNFRHSLCHGWSSGPVPFLSRHVLDIQIADPGCRKLMIAPNLGDLDRAQGAFPTPYGIVADMAYAILNKREIRASGTRAIHVLDVQECMEASYRANGAFVDVKSTCGRAMPLLLPTDGEESSLR